jgi:EpsD family peptidyl-prolyl cis-trans isomerase
LPCDSGAPAAGPSAFFARLCRAFPGGRARHFADVNLSRRSATNISYHEDSMLLPTRRSASCLSALALVLLLTACGGDDKKKPASQVAAKVNKEEISVHQVNAVLSRAGRLSAEQTAQASREVLEKLIDQELLVQKAIEKKLDRDPNILQALEAGRRQVLSQAYLEQLTSSAAKPSPEEIKAYFDKHPELFGERRVYRFQEVAVTVAAERLGAVQEQVAKSKSLNDLAAWFNANNIKFASNLVTKPAEQLPMELLPRLHQMKDGQVSLFPNANGLLLVQLVASQLVPLDLAAATPLIEQFTTNQRRSEMAAKEVSQIRAAAKIEYQGSFVKTEGEQKKAAEPAPAAAPAAPAAPAKGVSTEAVNKGVAGLK